MIWLQIAILLFLAFIFYQDMLYRAVYWTCFPVLGVLFLVTKYKWTGLTQTFLDAGYTMLFLLVQLLILWIYFSVKNKKAVNITHNYLGWGDILLLLTITFYLSPINYVVFYVFSLVLVLFYVIVTNVISSKMNKYIPLAGLQAVLLAVLLLMEMCTDKIKLYDDSWIYILIG